MNEESPRLQAGELSIDSKIETRRTGAIVILSQVPQVRSPRSLWKIPKIKDLSQADNNLVLTTELNEPET